MAGEISRVDGHWSGDGLLGKSRKEQMKLMTGRGEDVGS